MRSHNNIEVILFSKHALTISHKQALIEWLTTTVQPVIGKQDERAKKIFFRTLRNSPAIYLS